MPVMATKRSEQATPKPQSIGEVFNNRAEYAHRVPWWGWVIGWVGLGRGVEEESHSRPAVILFVAFRFVAINPGLKERWDLLSYFAEL